MYVDHPAFEKPENEQSKIWRYTSFIKFLSLISRKALYFSRLDYLGDPFEGSLPVADFENMRKGIEKAAELWEKMNVEYDPKDYKEMNSRIHQDERQIFFVNCWHLNENESSAMWDIYSEKDEGIAIQSTFKRLRDCFRGFDRTIWIGKVKYIDYNKESIPDNNSLNKFLCKRKSFEYEGELRAIIQPLDPGLEIPYHILEAIEKILQKQGVSTRGIYVDVDLENLIEKIYLSPLAEEWYLELIESILSKYNLDIKVEQSSLSNKNPLF
jgi:hypothetical protein